MKIKKVDDKPMVIHTKEKAKIHAHEPKGAKIKGSNIYTVERGPKVHDAKANEMDKKASAKLMLQKSTSGKSTYRKSTIHQSEAKDKGLSRLKRNIRESGTSIKTKNTNLHIAGRTGALAAGAVTEQVEGGQEVSQAAYLAYEAMGIAQDIQKEELLNNTFAFRYVKQLMDDYGISRVNADWIVSVWCSCYGHKVCDISAGYWRTGYESHLAGKWNHHQYSGQ